MSEDKWWGKTEEKKSSKETIEEMIDHTEMMRIKREEEIAEAQHEAELSSLNGETIVAKANDSTPVTQEPPRVQGDKGLFDWMTDDPGYLFLTIIVALGFVGMIVGGALTPSVDEKWETTDGIVLEGTEWWEDEIEYESRDHALFIAFAPYEDPKYAISVVVEHGGSGGSAAAPIAKKVIKKVLERHDLRQEVNNLIGEST